VTTTLVDTGPIVAFLNRRDGHHSWAVDTMARLRPPLLTCEAVLSEAIFLVRGIPGGGEAVMNMVERGVVRAKFRLEEEAAAVTTLLAKYGDVPMDLADACLVRMTEMYAEPTLVTVDTEFRDVYRRHGRRVIPTVLPTAGKRSGRSRSR
jgi:predicted nucleic acid-binding protein